MAQEQQDGFNQQNSNSLEQPSKGLYTDVAPINQPQGTYRYALNTVNESNEGDMGTLSNELSNKLYAVLPKGYIPIGSVYIGDGELCIFSTNGTNSEIGILSEKMSFDNEDVSNNYVTVVNDTDSKSKDKFNFRIDKQIQAVYRLRRGCDKMVYWTDNHNEPRSINLSKLENYKDSFGKYVAGKTSLIKQTSSQPIFDNITVKDGGGNLAPGSYNILLQLVDEQKNATKFLIETGNINIYNDATTDNYPNIDGSINRNFEEKVKNTEGKDIKLFLNGLSNKSIEVNVSNISSEYPYYRLAFVHYTNAEGTVSGVYLTDLINRNQKTFVYNGSNHKEKEEVNHIESFNRSVNISKAKSILIDSNRLVLSNVKGQSINYTNLQKFASKIATDCIIKRIPYSDVRAFHNPKNPNVGIDGMQFMPGEVYSLGIVYVFEDGDESPVFHIPGKISDDYLTGAKDLIYYEFNSTESNTYPMSNESNENPNLTYSILNNCNNSDYWGYDCNGVPLDGKKVRFHRFPKRDDVSVFTSINSLEKLENKSVLLSLNIENITSVTCKECNEDAVLKEKLKNYCYEIDGDFHTYGYNLEIRYVISSSSNQLEHTLKTKKISVSEDANIVETLIDSGKGNKQNSYVKDIIKKKLLGFEKKTEIYEYDSVNETKGNLISTSYESNPVNLNTIEDNGQKHIDDSRLAELPEDSIFGKRTETVDNVNNRVTVESYWGVIEEEVITFDSNNWVDNSVENSKEILLKQEESNDGKTVLKSSYKIKIVQNENIKSQLTGYFNILGIKLSNIELPSETVVGKKCVGYYIVKQERKKEDKTILGTGVGYRTWGEVSAANPTINKINCSYFNYTFGNSGQPYSSKIVPYNKGISIISPEHLFNGETFDTATDFEESGLYRLDYVKPFSYSGTQVQDVDSKKSFSSADGIDDLTSATKDDPRDGVTLRTVTKGIRVSYTDNLAGRKKYSYKKNKLDIFDLQPLSNAKIPGEQGLLFNMDMNSRRLVLIAKKDSGVEFNTYNKDSYPGGYNADTNNPYKYSYNNVYPYFIIHRKHNSFYSKYREDPYYRLHPNIEKGDTFESYNGDSFIGGLRPSSLVYLNMILALRVKDYTINRALKIIAGFVVAALITIATFGYGTAIGVAVGILLAAGAVYNGMYQQASIDNFNAAYEKYWLEGLFNSLRDDLVDTFFGILRRNPGETNRKDYKVLGVKIKTGRTGNSPTVANSIENEITYMGGVTGFTDDNFAWYNQTIQDLFFDTDININLRNTYGEEEDNYLRPQTYFMEDNRHKIIGNGSLMETGSFESRDNFTSWVSSNSLAEAFVALTFGPIGLLLNTALAKRGIYYIFHDNRPGVKIETYTEKYFVNKVAEIDKNYIVPDGFKGKSKEELLNTWGEHGYVYKYLATPEFYFVNKDYNVKTRQLKHYAIPMEYDFCSNCNEVFPQRFVWSEVSFAEELVDNYKIFKPNNYKDLSGEYGNITNSFTFNNKLYFHTEEALWYQPTNIQERVTNGIVSYLGTGEYGSLPAQLIIDDRNGNSAGLQHREACVLTPYGYFFVSEREQKIYKFDGRLTPISNIGINKWFDENIVINLDKLYKGTNGEEYTYRDNPSNKFGTGFILTYDKELERILVTKKDFLFTEDVLNNKDTYILIDKGTIVHYISNFKNKNKALKSGVVTPFKVEIMDSLIFLDSHGIRIDFEVPKNSKFRYEGIYNKRVVYSTWVYREGKNILVYGYMNSNKINKDNIFTNLSYTLSFYLKNNTWTSFHSYLPNFYARMNDNMFSYSLGQDEKNGLYIHSTEGSYQTFYGKLYPYIVEYVNNDNPLITKIFNHLRVITEAYKYDKDSKSFYEQRYITFNKAMFHNTRQCSGILDLFVKNTSVEEDYLVEQVQNLNNGTIIIDRNEKDWLMNDIRDYVVRYDKAIFNENRASFTGEQEFIDKKINEGIIDLEKDWYNLENFRDKFLVVRLIFDNFAEENKNTKLVLFITSENNNVSNY